MNDNPSKMIIAIVTPALTLTENGGYLISMASCLAELGHEVIFLTNYHNNNTETFFEVKHNAFPVSAIGKWLPASWATYVHPILGIIRGIQLSVVRYPFANVYVVDQMPLIVPFLKLTGARVCYYHDQTNDFTKFKLLNWIMGKCINLSNNIFVKTTRTKKEFASCFPNVNTPVEIIYPAVTDYVRGILKRITLPGPIALINNKINLDSKRRCMFAMLTNSSSFAYVETTLWAMQHLRNQLSPIQWKRVYLVIAGHLESDLKLKIIYDFIENHNMKNKIFHINYTSQKLTAQVILACDCFITTPSETYPPMQAMQAKKPIIAYSSDNRSEFVKSKVNGLISEVKAGTMAGTMRLMVDRKVAKGMGAVGKLVHDRHFSKTNLEFRVKSIILNVEEEGASEVDQREWPNYDVTADFEVEDEESVEEEEELEPEEEPEPEADPEPEPEPQPKEVKVNELVLESITERNTPEEECQSPVDPEDVTLVPELIDENGKFEEEFVKEADKSHRKSQKILESVQSFLENEMIDEAPKNEERSPIIDETERALELF